MTHLDTNSYLIQRAINTLADIDYIPASDKGHLLLVANGNKPTMHTGFFSDPIKDVSNVPESHTYCIDELCEIITSLGMQYKIQTKTLEKDIDGVQMHVIWTVICIAKDMTAAEELFNARERHDEKTEGILLGYPASAVEAFVTNNMIEISDVPVSTEEISTDDMKLLNHRLSKDNWQEEIKYLAEYARVLKQISPTIYAQSVSA